MISLALALLLAAPGKPYAGWVASGATPTLVGNAELTVALRSDATTNTLTTSSFTPQSNSLLILVINAGAGAGGNATSVTDSLGTHLTYTRRVNAYTTALGQRASEIWTAPVVTGASMTVTATFVDNCEIQITAYNVAGYANIGSTNSRTVVNGTSYEVPITPQFTNSILIWGMGGSGNSRISTTAMTLTQYNSAFQGMGSGFQNGGTVAGTPYNGSTGLGVIVSAAEDGVATALEVGAPLPGFAWTNSASTSMSLDAGYPVSGAAQTTSGTASWTTSTFSTSGNIRTIVVVASFISYDFASNSATITWNGGTPANATAFTTRIETSDVSAWSKSIIATATTTGPLTNVSATISRTGASGSLTRDAYTYSVYSIQNAGVVGVTAQHYQDNTLLNNYETLTGVTAGSYLFVAGAVQDNSMASQTNTTVDAGPQFNSIPDNGCATGHNFTGTSGNIIVGWTGSTNYSAIAAMELKAQ